MQGNLRFCANLKWLFNELPFEQRFQAAAAAGFTAVEYAAPYGFPAADQQQWLNRHGLQLKLINTPTGAPGSLTAAGLACHPGSTRAFLRDITLAIDYARVLSCPMIHVQSGIIPAGVSRQQALDTFCHHLTIAAGMAEKYGITLLLEAINQHDIPGYFLRTQADSLDVIRRVNAGNMGLLFDIYHCQRSEGDISTRLQSLMPLIKHIQVADAPERDEPGGGEIHWPFIFQQIRSLNYDGWIGCEYRPRRSTQEGLQWLADYR